MQLRTDKKGFTLVEVLVASALLVVLIAVAGGLIVSSMNNSGRYARMDNAKQIGLGVYNFYQARLQDATTIALDPDNTSITDSSDTLIKGMSGLRVKDGAVQSKPEGTLTYEGVYTEDFYSRMTIATAMYVTGTTMNLQVDVLYDGEVLFTKHSAFRLATLKRLNKSVQNVDFSKGELIEGKQLGAEDSPLTDPTIYYLP